MKRVAIFASGSGTNAKNIIEYFQSSENIKVTLVICNNPKAGVIEKSTKLGVSTLVLDNTYFKSEGYLINILDFHKIDLIVLCGFLRKVGNAIVDKYKVINIHPSLLPKYGGIGMYGMKVHQEVLKNKETKSGMTIHWVNQRYDEGKIIYQAECDISLGETPELLAEKVQKLEHKYYPLVIEYLLN